MTNLINNIKNFIINIKDNLVEFYNGLDTEQLILFYSVITILVIIIVLIGIFERRVRTIKNKREDLKEKRKNLTLVHKHHSIKEKEKPKGLQELVDSAFEDKTEEVIDESIETLEEPEEIRVKTEIEIITAQLEKDIKDRNINPTAFEKEQEEDAIISYEEFKTVVKKKEEPSQGIKDIYERSVKNEPMKEKKEFSSTTFISPIYGTEKKEEEIVIKEEPKKVDLEKTLNITPITEEIKNNNDFLDALKDFRKNLD